MMTVRNRRMRAAVALVALVTTLLPLAATAADPSPSVSTVGPTASPEPSPAIASPPPAPRATEPVPSANIDRPLTLEELLALRSRLADSRGRATVVATASIARDVPIRGPACWADIRCVFGVLEPTSERSGLILVRATRRVAALYPADDSPVQGTLAFAIDGAKLKLLGPFETPSGGYRTPLEEEAMAGADALPVGRLIAVDGWLGVLGYGVPCPAPPGILSTLGMSSPFVRCPGGWITADEALLETGPFNLYPPGFALPVQAAAYERFDPNPAPAVEGATPPRRAVYLLRHVANPRKDAEPATGWRVIGRLDPLAPEDPASPVGSGSPGPGVLPSPSSR